jgi:hypothetical protein
VSQRNTLQSAHGHNTTTTGISQHEIGAVSPAQKGLGLDRQETIRPLLRSTGTLERLQRQLVRRDRTRSQGCDRIQ